MKVEELLYVSCLCSREMERKLVCLDANHYGFQVQKYHRLLAKGFHLNSVSVKTISHPKNIETLKPEECCDEEEEGIHYSYVIKGKGGYPRLLCKVFLITREYLRQHRSAIIVCDVLNFTVSFGAALAAKTLNRKVIGVITDYPEQLSGKVDWNSRLIWILVSLCTGYVVLTEQMKERLSSKKPAIVLEGHVDSKMLQSENTLDGKYKKKVCLYAGALQKKYGVEKLVKAFLAADDSNAELHLYGDGDYVDELKKQEYNSVKYLGVAPNDEIIAEELKATILLNPRPSDAEFTKYSFPSKNMEYMASGTPLLTTKLPGMPKEYLEYVYLFDDESTEGMSRTLREVLLKPRKELHQKGRAAKKFILENKTEIIQARKILDFVLSC